jgi:regulator of RNase E activity RraA
MAITIKNHPDNQLYIEVRLEYGKEGDVVLVAKTGDVQRKLVFITQNGSIWLAEANAKDLGLELA